MAFWSEPRRASAFQLRRCSSEKVAQTLRDDDSRVREADCAPRNGPQALKPLHGSSQICTLAGGPTPRVRLQLALSIDASRIRLATLPTRSTLARLVASDPVDRSIARLSLRAGAGAGSRRDSRLFFEALVNGMFRPAPATAEFRRRYAKDRGADPKAIGHTESDHRHSRCRRRRAGEREQSCPLRSRLRLSEGLAMQGKKLKRPARAASGWPGAREARVRSLIRSGRDPGRGGTPARPEAANQADDRTAAQAARGKRSA